MDIGENERRGGARNLAHENTERERERESNGTGNQYHANEIDTG